MSRKLVAVLVAVLALAAAGVALGGGTLKLAADKTNKLAFDKKALRTTAGKVTIVVTVTLKKGKFRYVCTVPGHEAGGMWGILTVK